MFKGKAGISGVGSGGQAACSGGDQGGSVVSAHDLKLGGRPGGHRGKTTPGRGSRHGPEVQGVASTEGLLALAGQMPGPLGPSPWRSMMEGPEQEEEGMPCPHQAVRTPALSPARQLSLSLSLLRAP